MRASVLDYCYEPPDFDPEPPDFDPEIYLEPEYPRDPFVDDAKKALRRFFDDNEEKVFYQRQLQVIFETAFYHWITAHALRELVSERVIAVEVMELVGAVKISIYHAKSHRYWKRQADALIEIVAQFSDENLARAIGVQGEMMFDAALPTAGFMPKGRKVRSVLEKVWMLTGHDLDRVFERDGIAYGTEIKNTLDYIDREELDAKIAMCRHLGLRPLFIVRMAPKSYINRVREAGGFTLVFKYQQYPMSERKLAMQVREALQLPVDARERIEDGTVQRFLNWHLKSLERG